MWLKLLKATLPAAMEAHRKMGGIIPFGGYLNLLEEIVLIGHPEILPPTTGINSWVIQELQKHKQEAMVTIWYADVRYQNQPSLQIQLESARQDPTQIIFQIHPPKMLILKISSRKIW